MKKKVVQPYQDRYVKDKNKTMAKEKKAVKPVAKDTNKTRRKVVKPTKGKIVK